jgi:predicted negative regulator of RcsB-dependent stress response
VSNKIKIDKADLKAPDAFIETSSQAIEWLTDHFKTVVAVAVIGVIGISAWMGYGFLQRQKEQKATDAIYSAESELHKFEAKLDAERAKKTPAPEKGKKAAPHEEAPAVSASDYAPMVDKVKTAIRANSSTRAALVASLNLSYFLMQQKQPKEALEVLNIPSAKPPMGDVLGGLWQMHRGLVFLENHDADQAVQAYQKIVSAPALKTFHPEAVLKMGVAYQMKGDTAKAKESYEKVAREFPESEAANSAQQFLRVLELKGQQG